MASTKLQTVLRIEENVYEKIRVLARKDHRSINNMLEHILQSYIDEYELKHGTVIADNDE